MEGAILFFWRTYLRVVGFEVSSSTSFENNLGKKYGQISRNIRKAKKDQEESLFQPTEPISFILLRSTTLGFYYTDDRSKTVNFEKWNLSVCKGFIFSALILVEFLIPGNPTPSRYDTPGLKPEIWKVPVNDGWNHLCLVCHFQLTQLKEAWFVPKH